MPRAVVKDVIQPVEEEKVALDALTAALRRVPAGTISFLAAPNEQPLEIPKTLYRALTDAVNILAQGAAVAISPVQRRLTTTEAGDLLGVSRQYLTKLIDRKDIPCERTGRHRRLQLSDVLEYKRQRDAARLAALNDLTAEAAQMGAYE